MGIYRLGKKLPLFLWKIFYETVIIIFLWKIFYKTVIIIYCPTLHIHKPVIINKQFHYFSAADFNKNLGEKWVFSLLFYKNLL
jgi:hypothetical protein